jgi:Family of unknown function (DUF6953)
MPDYKKVAEWMLTQFRGRVLYQEAVVHKIKIKFGDEYYYKNNNGNYSIHRKVLTEFRKLTEGKVTWSRGEKAWTKARRGEILKRRVEE